MNACVIRLLAEILRSRLIPSALIGAIVKTLHSLDLHIFDTIKQKPNFHVRRLF